MKKGNILKISLTVLTSIVSFSLFSQNWCPKPFQKQSGSKKYHITVGAGATQLFGDLPSSNDLDAAFFVKGEYQILNGVTIGVEGQFGDLTIRPSDNDPRYVDNDYLAAGANVNIYPFQFFSQERWFRRNSDFNKELLKSIYLGAGVLGVRNHYTSIFRDMNNGLTYGPVVRDANGVAQVDANGDYVWKEKINSLALPSFNVGFTVPLYNTGRYSRGGSFGLAFNAQFNIATNDLFDGYLPYGTNGGRVGTKDDAYNFYSAGLKYSF